MSKLALVAEKLDGVIINAGDAKREIEGGYVGDLLSFAVGRATSGCAWFTVMNNENVCAVATLADVGTIVLCEGVKPSEQMLRKAKEHNVNIIGTESTVFDAVKLYSRTMKTERN